VSITDTGFVPISKRITPLREALEEALEERRLGALEACK